MKKEEPKFKLNDWVTDDDGRCIYQVGHIKNNRYYPKAGVYTRTYTRTLQKINTTRSFGSMLRLATEEEILYHLQKEFTNRTGIKIGSKVREFSYRVHKVAGFTLFEKVSNMARRLVRWIGGLYIILMKNIN